MLFHFDSVEQFARTCAGLPAAAIARASSFGLDWYGGLDWNETVARALRGDDSLVPQAEALIAKLEGAIEVQGYQVRPDVWGSRVSVPDYLAGSPTSMRRRAKVASDLSPIGVYVSVTSSASISAETLLRRGTAILALIMKLERVRPVSLRLITELDGVADGNHVQVIPIESQPLNLSTACFALARTGFDRHLCHAYGHACDGYAGGWAARIHDGETAYTQWLRDHVGMAPQDLYIKRAAVGDALLSDPVAWINQQVQKTMEEN